MDFLDTEDDYGSELNEKIAAAGEILQKLAEETGVDLNELSDEEVGELVKEVIEAKADEEKEEEDVVEEKAASDVTYADVAAELAKVAAANNIDMSKISRAEYTQAFDEIAAQLTDPEAHAEKVAAEQEYLAKVAEAEESGRIMARAFANELGLDKSANKAGVILDSAGNVVRSTLKQKATHTAPAKAVAKATSGASSQAKKIKDAIMKGIYGAQAGAGRTASSVDKSVQNLGATIAGKSRGGNALSPAAKRGIGYGTVGAGTLAVGGGGYGAYKAVKKSSDEDFEAAALEIAQDYVDKLASEEAVYERAAEILAANGYEI